MISIDEAFELLTDRLAPLAPRTVLAREAVGHVLAEAVSARSDSPPYDKALMDGYAVRSADVASPEATLRVLEEVTAGAVPTTAVIPGTATRIMTGAPMPAGADAVVPIEFTTSVSGREAEIVVSDGGWAEWRHVLRQAELMQAGEVILSSGHLLRGTEIGLLAELGHTHVSVYPRPVAAILATGDELLEAGAPLGPGQIWNSNGPLLTAAVTQHGQRAIHLGIVPDQRDAMGAAIRQGLEQDVLLLTGGVSMGVHDFVPEVLKEAGVECLFHKVCLKPGKPVWCGVRSDDAGPKLVFGLPGNPVSTLVCYELFVRPALQRLAGHRADFSRRKPAVLAQEFQQRGDRPVCFPGSVQQIGHQQPHVTPLPWRGSADLRTLASANCLIYFEAGTQTYEAGSPVTYFEIQ